MFVPRQWKKIFLVSKKAHTDSGTHPEASGFFARGKAAGRDVHHSLPSRAEDTNEWNYTPFLPIYLHGVDRGNFISLFIYLFTYFIFTLSLQHFMDDKTRFQFFFSSFIVSINCIRAPKSTETHAGFCEERWLRVIYFDGNLNGWTFTSISQSLQHQTSLTSIHRLPICWLIDLHLDSGPLSHDAPRPWFPNLLQACIETDIRTKLY